MTKKYRGAAHRDCNNNVKLNNKVAIVFHNLKNYDSYVIIQETCKFNLKINVILNRLEKYTSFSINYKLSFIDSFQILIFSWGSLVETLSKVDFIKLNEECDNKVLELVNPFTSEANII